MPPYARYDVQWFVLKKMEPFSILLDYVSYGTKYIKRSLPLNYYHNAFVIYEK